MKFITFVSAPANQPRVEFQRWFHDSYAAGLLRESPTLRGCLLRNTREAPPSKQSKDPDLVPVFPEYAVAMETWYSSTEDFRREARPLELGLREISARYISYRVTPRLQKDPRFAEGGAHGRRPEVTSIISLKWVAGLTRAQIESFWLEHVGLALRVQPSMTKYEQNLIDEVISWTPDTPAMDGYVDLSFNTLADLDSKFIGTEEEAQDVARFVAKYFPAYLGDVIPIR